jgi:hypothetical protein
MKWRELGNLTKFLEGMMGKARIIQIEQDNFRPEYGGVQWVRRLNAALEEANMTLQPLGYTEQSDNTRVMQVTQENTHIYINQIADEMDCIAVGYEYDPDGIWTFMYREKFEDDDFMNAVNVIGPWAMQVVTLYPLEHVVDKYLGFKATDLGDTMPDDWA